MNAFHPHLLDRRLGTAQTAVWVVLGIIILSFFRTQILGHGKFQLQSETNRLRPIPLPAPRGVIYDRRGQIIADNAIGYSVSVLVQREDSLRALLQRLTGTINLTSGQIEQAARRFRRAPTRPTVLLPDATFDVVSVLEEHRADFPGLIIELAAAFLSGRASGCTVRRLHR